MLLKQVNAHRMGKSGYLVNQRLNIIQNYNMATKDADTHKLKLRSLYAPIYSLLRPPS